MNQEIIYNIGDEVDTIYGKGIIVGIDENAEMSYLVKINGFCGHNGGCFPVTKGSKKALNNDGNWFAEGSITLVKQPKCSIAKEVRNDIKQRAKVGLKKYDTTLDRTDLNLRDWLQHAYEETLDNALYLKRAMKEMKNK